MSAQTHETQVGVIIWTSALRGSLAQRVITQLRPELSILGVGGPDAAERERLGRAFDCATGDDFRKLLIDRRPKYVFVADCQGLNEGDFAAAVGQGATVLTVEPVVEALSNWAASRKKARALVGATAPIDAADRDREAISIGRVIQVPAMTRSRGWLSAADPSEALGTLRLIAVTNFGGKSDWSLFGRLFDAWWAVLEWSDLPLTIDASLAGSADRIPETLREAHGSLVAHARLPGGGAASVAVNDATGGHTRRLEVVADGGRLSLQDHQYCLLDQTGHTLDQLATDTTNDPATTTIITIEDLIVEQWRSAMTPQPASHWLRRHVEDWEVTACCLASLLSARTGDPERPGRLLELHGFA